MLQLEIARCPNVVRCKGGEFPHPCAEVVGYQRDVDLAHHQVPEPWSGDIESAKLLFVSSNPSLSGTEEYPLWSWPDDDIADFFTNRFGGGRKAWVKRNRGLQLDGTHASRPTRFWSGVHQRAVELLGPAAVPGRDYALTEVVRCKSTDERGVAEAVVECTRRYFARTLKASRARIVLIVGEHARRLFFSQFGFPERFGVHGPERHAGIERYFVSIGHPSSGDPQRLVRCIGGDRLSELREVLARAPAG